jgi:hypothetical protein
VWFMWPKTDECVSSLKINRGINCVDSVSPEFILSAQPISSNHYHGRNHRDSSSDILHSYKLKVWATPGFGSTSACDPGWCMRRDGQTLGDLQMQQRQDQEPQQMATSGMPPRPTSSARLHPRMQYRRQPVSVAVDLVSLVISECIAITSALQKHARSPHSSVSAILGGGPSTFSLRAPGLGARDRSKSPAGGVVDRGSHDRNLPTTRWGLRGEKGRSMQDNPLMAGFGKLRHEISAVKSISHSSQTPLQASPSLMI